MGFRQLPVSTVHVGAIGRKGLPCERQFGKIIIYRERGVDLLRSLVEITDKAQLLGAIGPFPDSSIFRELLSAAGLYRTRGNHRAEEGSPLGGTIGKEETSIKSGGYIDICARSFQ